MTNSNLYGILVVGGSKVEITIYHRYSKLEKCHYYSISQSETSIMSQWLWFYIGKYLKIREDRKNFSLLPYRGDGKLIKEYKAGNGTKEYGKLVVNTIQRHYRKRK